MVILANKQVPGLSYGAYGEHIVTLPLDRITSSLKVNGFFRTQKPHILLTDCSFDDIRVSGFPSGSGPRVLLHSALPYACFTWVFFLRKHFAEQH